MTNRENKLLLEEKNSLGKEQKNGKFFLFLGNREMIEIQLYIYIYIPENIYVFVCKMMVFVYEDESVRVVVHTANLVGSDWENRTQAGLPKNLVFCAFSVLSFCSLQLEYIFFFVTLKDTY